MPVHYAAARSRASSPLARIIGNGRVRIAANDEPSLSFAPIDELTEATLRHFAEHGLGAARAAREQAEEARRAGVKAESEYWLQICRNLDRQEAIRFERSDESLIG